MVVKTTLTLTFWIYGTTSNVFVIHGGHTNTTFMVHSVMILTLNTINDHNTSFTKETCIFVLRVVFIQTLTRLYLYLVLGIVIHNNVCCINRFLVIILRHRTVYL